MKPVKEKIAAGLRRVGGAVKGVLAAAHSKKDMIDLRREKLQKLLAPKEDR